MTLSELYLKFFPKPIASEATKMYVFDSEDCIDNWVSFKYFGDNNIKDFELITILSTDKAPEEILLPKWCNSEVEYFYATEPDVMAVLVKLKS